MGLIFSIYRKKAYSSSFDVEEKKTVEIENLFCIFFLGVLLQTDNTNVKDNSVCQQVNKKQELQEVGKFPIEIFWNIKARHFLNF